MVSDSDSVSSGSWVTCGDSSDDDEPSTVTMDSSPILEQSVSKVTISSGAEGSTPSEPAESGTLVLYSGTSPAAEPVMVDGIEVTNANFQLLLDPDHCVHVGKSVSPHTHR